MKTVPLRHVAKVLNGGTPGPSEVNWGGSVKWATPVDMARVDGDELHDTDRTLTQLGADSGSTIAPAGSVLVSSRAPIGYTAMISEPMAFNQGCKALVPDPARLDPRFLQFALIAITPTIKAFGSGSTFQEISGDSMASQTIPKCDLDEQRRVANFLEDRVARIDRIIAARREQILLGRAAIGGGFERALMARGVPAGSGVEVGWRGLDLPDGWRASVLGRVLRRLTNGYVGPTRDILRDRGVRYIQGVHIKAGVIDFARRPFFVSSEWHHDRPRISLCEGDVLIVQTGDIGQVALVPPDFGEASCHALLIARADREVVRPDYLVESLRSDFGQHSMRARATGALHPHLEGGVRSTPLVLPQLSDQQAIVEAVRANRSSQAKAQAALTRSIELLTEYKSSLITAAVTGELDVTTAGSGIPA